MDNQFLSKGQTIELPAELELVDIVITWENPEFGIDAAALLLGPDRKVGSDADFVFYNQQESIDGSVRYLGRRESESGPHERLLVHLTSVPEHVDAIALAGSVDSGAFGDLGKLTIQLVDSVGAPLAEHVTADASSETAFVFGEIYRRNGTWKLRAVGQGWESGLAGLAQDFGVEVSEESTAEDPAHVDSEPSPEPPATEATPLPKPTRRRGVRTSKPVPKKAPLPVFKLAEAETWQRARLFSVIGVGSGEEQERRTTSALVSTMQAVPLFARAVSSRVGAPAGAFEGYVEVPYAKGESRVIPDAVWRIARGSRLWTGLLEAKTGAGTLTREQLENYLDVAKKHKYDVVISLSNDLPAGVGELPVEVDKRKLTKVALRHLSWAEVIHEARMVLSHGGIDNPLQGWILSEFLRYIEHPKSGAAEFVDMGRHWVSIRDSVGTGTLRAGDPKAAAVAQSWIALARNLALRFTADLGVTVKHVLPRRVVNDAEARTALTVNELANDGTFSATLRIPDAAGELRISANLRTNKVSCSTTVSAPDEGTAGKRVSWILRQLKSAPEDLLVEAAFTGPAASTCETLASARATPRLLTDGQGGQVSSFVLTRAFTLGSKRSGTAASFINSVTGSAESFYADVVQPLREWVPSAPKAADLPREEQPDELE